MIHITFNEIAIDISEEYGYFIDIDNDNDVLFIESNKISSKKNDDIIISKKTIDKSHVIIIIIWVSFFTFFRFNYKLFI